MILLKRESSKIQNLSFYLKKLLNDKQIKPNISGKKEIRNNKNIKI